MSYRELCKWGIYYGMEPFGEWRADYRNAQLCALQANLNRDAKKRPKPYEVHDFMAFDQAEKRRKQRESKGQIEQETVDWFFGRAGVPVPKEQIEEALKRVAPNLTPEAVAKLMRTKRGD